MSQGRFETEAATMETAARHVYEVNEQIQSQLANLLSRLEPLMGSWQGGAATSFHGLKERWHENATKLNQALRGIGDGLVKAKETYVTTEEAAQRGFTTMTGNLE